MSDAGNFLRNIVGIALKVAGVAKERRRTWNFVDAGVVVTDNQANDQLDISVAGVVTAGAAPVGLPSYTATSLPTATVGRLIYVTDEAGGAVPAFADGTNWRRCTDRAIVS